MLIRECGAEDLATLEAVAPTGSNDGHGQRFRRQRAGNSTFLVAVQSGVPVGTAEVLWCGGKDPDVRATYPDCPEINGLSVFPAELRGQGIGTALIRAAEQCARERGFIRIGLGVVDDNPDAARLYRRLDYLAGVRYVDSYSYLDAAGTKHVVNDPAIFMTKDLAG